MLSVSGLKLSWNKVDNINTYVFVIKIPGQTDRYGVVTGTSATAGSSRLHRQIQCPDQRQRQCLGYRAVDHLPSGQNTASQNGRNQHLKKSKCLSKHRKKSRYRSK